MLDHGFRLGIVDDRRAFAESVAAANPHLAVRILGRPLPKPPMVTAPIVLAAAAPNVTRIT